MPANYVLLERIELNASAASIIFNNIPQTGYTDLKVVLSARGDVNNTAVAMQFNGSTSSYSMRYIYGSGSGTASYTSSTGIFCYANSSTYTASTFGNSEFYIPNYNSTSTFKSVSTDNVTENNATAADMQFGAGLWSNNSAITSITLVPASGNFVANSTFSLYGLAAVGTTPVIAPKASGGNRIDYDGTYWIHTFTTTGAFVPQTGLTCDYLVVAGGGSGGSTNQVSGGGGAGGLRSTVTATGGGGSLESAISLASNTSYTVTVGAGGAAVAEALNINGNAGSNSSISTITATGGGGGGGSAYSSALNGSAGGSGGGGGAGEISGAGTGGAGTSNQGYAGGNGAQASGAGSAGGGGGAGAVGANASNNQTAGAGGAGVAVAITGSSVTYAGGGGGGGNTTGGSGGSSIGGTGGQLSGGVGRSGTNGAVNTGSGGGGSRTGNSGAGGSGIVIIRYLAA